jgi:hypothetical protein
MRQSVCRIRQRLDGDDAQCGNRCGSNRVFVFLENVGEHVENDCPVSRCATRTHSAATASILTVHRFWPVGQRATTPFVRSSDQLDGGRIEYVLYKFIVIALSMSMLFVSVAEICGRTSWLLRRRCRYANNSSINAQFVILRFVR